MKEMKNSDACFNISSTEQIDCGEMKLAMSAMSEVISKSLSGIVASGPEFKGQIEYVVSQVILKNLRSRM